MGTKVWGEEEDERDETFSKFTNLKDMYCTDSLTFTYDGIKHSSLAQSWVWLGKREGGRGKNILLSSCQSQWSFCQKELSVQ